MPQKQANRGVKIMASFEKNNAVKRRQKHFDFKNISGCANLITAIATIGLVLVAAYGFRVNREVTRMQTSMDFYTMIYPILQSDEFTIREQYLIYSLSQRRNIKPACSIYKIEDEQLRRELIKYCECMNGIGVLMHEHMINSDVIVPYIGTKSTILYELIRPYLDITRQEMAEIHYDFFDLSQNEKIQKASALYLVHYELLALTMREEGPNITNKFEKKLIESRQKTIIYETYK